MEKCRRKKSEIIKTDNQFKVNILFVICVFFGLLIGLLNTIFNADEINYYENRTAYKMPVVSYDKFISKSFQNEFELFFSDQLPLAVYMKKINNFTENVITNLVADYGFKNNCNNRYIQLSDTTVSFGCDKNLVYYECFVSYTSEDFEKRVTSINNTLKNTKVDTYIYYIEKDTDIDFTNNSKSDIYDYLKSNINTKKMYKYEVNSFDDFKENFYKTDHHWNYKGSYKSYEQLVKILTNDKPLEYKNEECLNSNFSGSKASFSGARYFYKEEFCSYVFDFPEYEIYINGKKGTYGNEDWHLNNKNESVSYGSYYGDDVGEVIIDNHNAKKENILIVGESYDNALLKLLAYHFNKTYSIDLRNYKDENGKDFNYTDYLKEKDIDKVLLIGSREYFIMSEFNLEV